MNNLFWFENRNPFPGPGQDGTCLAMSIWSEYLPCGMWNPVVNVSEKSVSGVIEALLPHVVEAVAKEEPPSEDDGWLSMEDGSRKFEKGSFFFEILGNEAFLKKEERDEAGYLFDTTLVKLENISQKKPSEVKVLLSLELMKYLIN